jgi:hypothetical protein
MNVVRSNELDELSPVEVGEGYFVKFVLRCPIPGRRNGDKVDGDDT